MTTASTLQVIIEGDSSRLQSALAQGAQATQTFNTKMSGVASAAKSAMGVIVPVSAAAAGFAVAKFAKDSIDAAVATDRAFTQIAAVSNTTDEQLGKLREQTMSLAGETAQAPAKLADALYFLSSAGLDAQQVSEALDASARASAVGMGSAADVARITANALNAYAGSGLDAARVTDVLVAAVREGTAAPEEFAGALGRVLPIASEVGIGFDQVAASLATMSNAGLDVNEGVTALRGILQALAAPTQQTSDALQALGLSADDVRASLAQNGLIATLRMLEERTGGNIDTMRLLVPNVRALTGVLNLNGQEAAKVDGIYQRVAHSQGSLGKAFEETAQSSAFKMQKALNDIAIAGEELAAQVLPLLAQGLNLVADAFGALGAFAPILAKLMPALVALGTAYAAVKVATLAWAAANAVVAASLQAVAGVAVQTTAVMALTGSRLAAMRAGLNAAIGPTLAWTAALALSAVAVQKLQNYMNMDDQAAAGWVEQIESGKMSLDDLKAAVDRVTGDKTWTDKFNGDQTVLDAFGKTVEQVRNDLDAQTRALAEGTDVMETYGGWLLSLTNTNMKARAEFEAMLVTLDRNGVVLTQAQENTVAQYVAEGDLASATRYLGQQTNTSTGYVKKLAEAHGNAAKAAREQRAAELALAGGLLGIIGSLQQLHDDQKTLNDLERQGKTNTDEYREAQTRLLQDQLSLTNALRDQAQKMNENGVSITQTKQKLWEIARQAGMTRDEFGRLLEKTDGLRGALDRLPSQKKVDVQLIDHVSMPLSSIQSKLSGLAARYGIDIFVHAGGLIAHRGGLIPKAPAPVFHAGGPTDRTLESDERLAVLQTGEFVMRRSATRRIGVDALRAMNRFHDGGTVGATVSPRTTQATLPVNSRGTSMLVEILRRGNERTPLTVRLDRRRFTEDLQYDDTYRGW